MINNIDFNDKCASFTKTHLLIIISGMILDYWNTINKSMLMKIIRNIGP